MARDDGGTDLAYSLIIKPRSMFAAIIVWLQINFFTKQRFARAFKNYDELALQKTETPAQESKLDSVALSRLETGAIQIAGG